MVGETVPVPGCPFVVGETVVGEAVRVVGRVVPIVGETVPVGTVVGVPVGIGSDTSGEHPGRDEVL